MPAQATEPQTLTAALLGAPGRFPGRGIGIYDGRGRRVERRTYAEVVASAEAAAARFAALGIAPGDRVLVSLPTSWEWLDAWLGALLLGALPVAIAPAGAMGSSTAHTERVAAILERIGGRLLITGEALRAGARELGLEELAEAATTPEELAA
ncbi:MAG: AMP-binding protein, partial [Acidobacteria bacterium]|nr:AMP-binding protein [Acidobacteriota bacterium]